MKEAARALGVNNPMTAYEFAQKHGIAEAEVRAMARALKSKNSRARVGQAIIFDEQEILKTRKFRILKGIAEAPTAGSGRTEQLLQALVEQNNKILEEVLRLAPRVDRLFEELCGENKARTAAGQQNFDAEGVVP